MMRALVSFVGIVLLSACTNGSSGSGSTIYFTDYGRYSASTAVYAARNGQMPLVVYGNPTGADQPTLNAAVARGLAGTHVAPAVAFSPVATQDAPTYRTVVVFGGTTRDFICSAKPITTSANRDGPMSAAFCLDSEPLSFASGALQRLDGANDPKLQTHMASVGYALFPIANPNHADDCGPGRASCK